MGWILFGYKFYPAHFIVCCLIVALAHEAIRKLKNVDTGFV